MFFKDGLWLTQRTYISMAKQKRSWGMSRGKAGSEKLTKLGISSRFRDISKYYFDSANQNERILATRICLNMDESYPNLSAIFETQVTVW